MNDRYMFSQSIRQYPKSILKWGSIGASARAVAGAGGCPITHSNITSGVLTHLCMPWLELRLIDIVQPTREVNIL